MKLKELKQGEFFALRPQGEKEVRENVVWVRGEYDRSTKTYSCIRFSNVNHENFMKGTREVYTDFIF